MAASNPNAPEFALSFDALHAAQSRLNCHHRPLLGANFGSLRLCRRRLTMRQRVRCRCERWLCDSPRQRQQQRAQPIVWLLQVWAHPLDIHYSTGSLSGWPKIHFQVWQQVGANHTGPPPRLRALIRFLVRLFAMCATVLFSAATGWIRSQLACRLRLHARALISRWTSPVRPCVAALSTQYRTCHLPAPTEVTSFFTCAIVIVEIQLLRAGLPCGLTTDACAHAAWHAPG
jgi:hypothetical protein